MKKCYVIQEVPTEYADFSSYFDGDYFTEKSGDYCNTLFIIQRDYGRVSGINSAEYERVENELCDLITDFDWVKDKGRDYDGRPITYKKVMLDHGIKYSPAMCHKLKMFCESIPEFWKVEAVAEYLTIKTGKKWETTSAAGYCQGDYCEIVYCSANYTEKAASEAGEIFCGAAFEYDVICLGENGEEENERIGGYIIPDSIWNTEERKNLICKLACINPEETAMEVITGYRNAGTIYEYEEV